MENAPTARQLRRPKSIISSVAANYLHLRNPWVTALWSCIFPGLGHIMLGKYTKGFMLVLLEVILNQNAKINTAIIYAFTGRFDLSREVLDKRWVLMYCGIYVYAIWDSYSSTIDLNKLCILADREKSPLPTVAISCIAINYLDKKNPWVAYMWSLIVPGSAHFYSKKLMTGFIMLGWWLIIAYLSHLMEAVIFSFTGNFAMSKQILDSQWALFLPSLYVFSVYDAYVCTIEYNNLFEIEQNMFLENNYQNNSFPIPL
jgi:TM2 domain-containing membrane protein YozV